MIHLGVETSKEGEMIQLSSASPSDAVSLALKEDSESRRITGFHFLMSLDMGEEGERNGYQFIVAMIEGELVGVLQYARYTHPAKTYISESLWHSIPDYYSLHFIDVREDKREQGIATALLKGWNTHLEAGEMVRIGRETEIGKKIGMLRLAKREMRRVQVRR